MSCRAAVWIALAAGIGTLNGGEEPKRGPSERALPFLRALGIGTLKGGEEPKRGPSERAERLVRALSHPEFAERERATEALSAAGAEALEAIRPLLASGDGETAYRARRVFHAIRGFSPEVEQRIAKAVQTVNQGALPEADLEIAAIVDAGPAAVGFALEGLASSKGEHAAEFREHLLVRRSLREFAEGGRWGSPDALRGIGSWGLGLLRKAAEDRSEIASTRVFALNALRQLSPKEVTEAALELLCDPSSQVRQLALLHLTELVTPADFKRVAEREAALPGRSFLEGRRLTEQLARQMELAELREGLKDGSGAVRAATAWALGMRRDKESRYDLKRLLDDGAAAVRIEAAQALGAIGDAEDIAVIGGRLGKEGDPEASEACLEALSGFGEKAIAWVAVALRDGEPSVRRRAAVLLGRAKNRKALHALFATLGDEDPSVEAEALASISALSGVDLPHLVGVGTKEEREHGTQNVKGWWAENRKAVAEGGKLLGELAIEGGEVLTRLADILGANFLSVKAQKEAKPAKEEAEEAEKAEEAEEAGHGGEEPQAPRAMKQKEDGRPPEVKPGQLKEVAVKAARAAVYSDKVSIGSDVRGPLEAVLARGTFRSLGDMGEFLGALPLAWDRKGYVEFVNCVVKGVVASLGDPFSRILVSHDPEGRFSKEIIPLLFGGAKTNGIMIKRAGEDVIVDFVLSASPAFRADLRYGDQIVMIGGKPIEKGLTREEINDVVNRGVKLTVFRQGWPRPFIFELEPEEVFEQEPVRFTVLPGKIGYLWLHYFGTGADTKVEWALREMEKQGIRGLVFDLRNNPGGLGITCTSIVDKFIGEKVKITTFEGRSGKERKQEIMSTASETDREYPLSVLVNRSSASASELMSGALQDMGRAILVGERTYGKGIGQAGFTIPGFSGKSLFGETATFYLLSLTTVRYFFASGKNPHGVGVAPERDVSPGTPTGDRFLRLYELTRSKQFRDYVEKLAGHDGAAALARWDARDASRYPDFDAFLGTIVNAPSRDDVRRAVRKALRGGLAEKNPASGFSLPDPVEDRVLRAGMDEVASKLKIENLEVLFEAELARPGEEVTQPPAEAKKEEPPAEAKKPPPEPPQSPPQPAPPAASLRLAAAALRFV